MVWDIFEEMRRMQEEMDRLFSDFFAQPYRRLGPGKAVEGVEPERRMPSLRKAFTDVQETDREVIVTAELPGMNREDIELHVTAENLEVKAQKKEEHKEEKEGYRAYGRRYSGFYRNVPLPTAIQPDDAKATYKNGVLEVILPKKEVSESHKLKID